MDARLIVIENDEELAHAQALVSRLMDATAPPDVARLEAQARLVEAYERKKWPAVGLLKTLLFLIWVFVVAPLYVAIGLPIFMLWRFTRYFTVMRRSRLHRASRWSQRFRRGCKYPSAARLINCVNSAESSLRQPPA